MKAARDEIHAMLDVILDRVDDRLEGRDTAITFHAAGGRRYAMIVVVGGCSCGNPRCLQPIDLVRSGSKFLQHVTGGDPAGDAMEPLEITKAIAEKLKPRAPGVN